MILLSPEQRSAIITPGNLLVRAGAGTGKTEVLARRFIALIAGDIAGHSPLQPEQVAAITFTEKAAHDMRARIASVLEERIFAEKRERARSHLVRAHTLLTTATISTIHAFCARMLHENALEAALDPDFEVLDEYESQTFLERFCRQVLIDKVRQSDPGACYLARVRRLDTATPREGAVLIVLRILDEVSRLGRTSQWLCEATCAMVAQLQTEASRVESLAHNLAEQFDGLLAVGRLTDAAEERLAPLRIRHGELREQILAINAKAEPAALDFLREFCECIPKAQGAIRHFVNSIRKIVCIASSNFGLDGELISAYGACRAAPKAQEIAATILDLARRFEAAKAEERIVTFDDLLFRTAELLERNVVTRRRYQESIRALLVDEFQDTDPIQHEIVARLIEPQPGVPSPELFLVGDEKQSIYRFRGADVAGFERIRNRLGSRQIDELPLLGNRRSTPNIVAFVNGLGAALMHSGEPEPPPYWVEWGSQHELQALRKPQLDSAVEIITAIPDSPYEPPNAGEQNAQSSMAPSRRLNAGRKRVLEARAISARIRRLVGSEMITDPVTGGLREIRYRDTVLLLRAFTDVAIYEEALLDASIPCYTVKGRGFFGCQEVLDFIQLLTAIDNPRDSLALAAALRSPFFGFSDDCLAEIALHQNPADNPGLAPLVAAFAEGPSSFALLSAERDKASRAYRILTDLRQLAQRGTIIGVVQEALAATGYEAVMLGLRQGPQRVANLHKLTALARDFESRRLFTFHDFVVHLRRLAEQQPYEPPAQILRENEDVVRLMTVHQAKGLEFPMVIVVDAGRRPEIDNRNPVADPESGLLLRDAAGSGMDEIPNRILTDFRRRNNEQQQAESLRLLYVALTRARDRLIISEGAMLQGWAKDIRTFVGDESCTIFDQSRREEQTITRGGAQIRLIRPRFAPTGETTTMPTITADAEQFIAVAQHRLSFEPPSLRELIISPTALADFARCPRQFHLRHRLKMPESGFDGEDSSSGALTMGTVAHAVLERLRADGAAEAEIRTLTDQLGIAAGLTPGERAKIAADLIRYIVKVAGTAPAAREASFFYHVGEGVFVRGQIDAVLHDDGQILVRDYKYARAADEGALYQVQMEAYALAAADAIPQSRVEAELVFLKDDGMITPVALPTLEEMRAHLLSIAGELLRAQTSGEFSKKPSSPTVCYKLRCGYVARCWSNSGF